MTTLVISYRQTLLLAVWSVLLSLVLIGYFLLSASGEAQDAAADPGDEGQYRTVPRESISWVKGDSFTEKWMPSRK